MKKLFSIKYTATSFDIAMLLLRLVAGLTMAIGHGFDKLSHFNSKLAGWKMDPFGLGTTVTFSLVVFAEFFCAIFIILGLFTRLSAIPLIICMSFAFFSAHGARLFNDGESAGIFLMLFTLLLLIGPGRISADRLIGK